MCPQGGSTSSYPTLVTGGKGDLGKIVWNVPAETPKLCVPFLHPSYTLQPRRTPSSVKSSHWGCCIPGGQLWKKEAGAGNLNSRCEAQEAFQSSSIPEGAPSFKCPTLRKSQLDLDFVVPSGGGPGTPCPRGNSFSGTSSPGLLTLGQSSLGNEAYMGSSLWHQPRSPRPEWNIVSFSFFFKRKGKKKNCCFWVSDIYITFCIFQFSSVAQSSLRPHEPQHARPPCPSPTPGVHSNPCPLSRWCHPTISSSVIPLRLHYF